MSKNATWTDHIGESSLPADEFTWTEGSNYGLDGFTFDQTLGEGLKNHGDQSGMAGPIVPAQTSGMSELPDGFVTKEADDMDFFDGDSVSLTDEVDGLDLGGMLSEEEGALPLTAAAKEAASLADLVWLDPTQEQDPSRLPKPLRPDVPPLNSIPELEEAWGVNRRTDGLNLIPNRDKAIAEYEQSFAGGLPATPGVEKADSEKKAWHIKKAVRMSHYGETMGSIANYLYANLDPVSAQKAVGIIAADHGVAGKVFIRASAFPGLRNGKWVQELRRIARTARYVITDDPLIATKLGMTMVSEVPWKKALALYQPHLKAAGYRVASVEGDAKKTLQLAFLTGPMAVTPGTSYKPVDVRPADRVSVAEAKAALRAAPKASQEVVAKDDRAAARKRVLGYMAQAVRLGHLPAKDALRLGQSTATPEQIRRVADQIIQAGQVKQADYRGEGTKWRAFQREARDNAWVELRQAELTAHAMTKARQQVANMVTAGLLTKKEAAFALGKTSAAEILKVAAVIYKASHFHRKDEAPVQEQRRYEGAVYRQAEIVNHEGQRKDAAWAELQEAYMAAIQMKKAQAQVQDMVRAGLLTKKEALQAQEQSSAEDVLKVAKTLVQAAPLLRKASIPATKVRDFQGAVYTEAAPERAPKQANTTELLKLAGWLRRQMSEGMAGQQLTALMNLRFASPLQKAGAEMIATLRSEHEGLSGHLYVDAAAYATPTGTKGCEAGALKHRANDIQYVRAMDRCAGCSLRNANNVCTKYGKQLLTRMPKNAADFQRKIIHMADAPDHEATASLFNPSEFSLQAPGMVTVDDPAVTEDLGSVLFDGFSI